MTDAPLLVRVLLTPSLVTHLDEGQLDLLLRQARVSRLIARLHATLEQAGLLDAVLPALRQHLDAAAHVLRHQHRALMRELHRFSTLFAPMGIEPVLLKGAAYVAAGLDAARGRSFSDIDVLVPEDRLGDVESRLMRDGWMCLLEDAYDQRYYRTWMHEIPPLTHMKRGTSLDVHHAITPRTARVRADSEAMRAAAVTLPELPGLRVLCPTDRVLHSAAHLFLDGEFDAGLRDLFDLRSLIEQSTCTDPQFPAALGNRAAEVGLERPLHYALRYLERLLYQPGLDAVRTHLRMPPPGTLRSVGMDALFRRALRPHHPSCSDAATPVSLWALYVRGHWLRMPTHLLLAHLTRKALRREENSPDNPG